MQKFLPKGVLKSSRTHYLEMIGAACSYLLDMDVSMDKFRRRKNRVIKKRSDYVRYPFHKKEDKLDSCYKPNQEKKAF